MNLEKHMQNDLNNLEQKAEALRKDWTYFESFGLGTAQLRDRSKVFCRQIRIEDREVQVFIKVYANKKHPLQRIFRKGRSHTEARNLLFFQSIGIPTPALLAWGERKNTLGRIVEEFIITEAIPDSLQLDDFVPKHCPDRSNPQQRALRDQIIDQMAEWTSRMHAAHFIHEDLKWRNILASLQGESLALHWIDCPKGRFFRTGSRLEYKKIKDCATLDKLARIHCSREERQRFVRAYLGASSGEIEVARMCKKIEEFREVRFDPEDNRQLQAAQQ